jgi:hypothetical protein
MKTTHSNNSMQNIADAGQPKDSGLQVTPCMNKKDGLHKFDPIQSVSGERMQQGMRAGAPRGSQADVGPLTGWLDDRSDHDASSTAAGPVLVSGGTEEEDYAVKRMKLAMAMVSNSKGDAREKHTAGSSKRRQNERHGGLLRGEDKATPRTGRGLRGWGVDGGEHEVQLETDSLRPFLHEEGGDWKENHANEEDEEEEEEHMEEDFGATDVNTEERRQLFEDFYSPPTTVTVQVKPVRRKWRQQEDSS